jgi:hypothetical protein
MTTPNKSENPGKYNEHRIFEGIYETFEDELLEIGRYIAFSSDNFNVYSNKIHELHLRVCSEIENVLKIVVHRHFVLEEEVCKQWESKKSACLEEKGLKEQFKKLCSSLKSKEKKDVEKLAFGFPDFRFYYDLACEKFNLHEKIVIFAVSISPDIKHDVCQPFMTKKEDAVPIWWTKYNKIKHNKIGNYNSCSLGNLVNAMAGLYILMSYLIKYSEGNSSVFDPNYFRDNPNRMYTGCKFLAFPSRIYQATCAHKFSLPIETPLPYELSIEEHTEVERANDHRLGPTMYSAAVVVQESMFLTKNYRKESCIFHTYFDYRQCFRIGTLEEFKQLAYYGKFEN